MKRRLQIETLTNPQDYASSGQLCHGLFLPLMSEGGRRFGRDSDYMYRESSERDVEAQSL